MRLDWLGMALGAALAASPAAAATLEPSAEERDVRTLVMWFPADRLWAGALPNQGCGPRVIEPTGDITLAAPLRRATYERRGELIAELRGPRRLNFITLDTARRCAARAVETATVPAMLSASVGPWDTFQGSLSACLRETGAAKNLGSMTLWVDTSCNW